jgi:hypothetical protein
LKENVIVGRLIPAGTGNPDNKNIIVKSNSTETEIPNDLVLEEKEEK